MSERADQPRRRWWLYGVGGTLGLAILASLSLVAVLISVWFVVLYAKVGPIPGQKVARPVDDLGGLVTGHDPREK